MKEVQIVKKYLSLYLKNSRIVSYEDHNKEYSINQIKEIIETYNIDELNVIDLDGAFEGEFVNYSLLRELTFSIDKQINAGGGIRGVEQARRLMECADVNLLLGTMVVNNKENLLELVNEFKHQVVVSVDTYDDSLCTEGWEDESDQDINSLLKELELLEISQVIITDVKSMLEDSPVQIKKYAAIAQQFGFDLILRGGISLNDDLKSFEDLKLSGVVIEDIF